MTPATFASRRGRKKSKNPRRQARPFVLVNMAMTSDGKIATANRAVSSFGSRRDQDHLLELRATGDAVMAGARTVDSNAVNLGPGPLKYRKQRLKRGLAEYNLRVIVSGAGTVDPNSEIFLRRFSPIIVLTTGRATPDCLAKLRELADEVKVCGSREIDFVGALQWLRKRWKVKRLLCEGGGELNDALFGAGLVDELHLTVAPKIFGGRTAPTIASGSGVARLADARQLEITEMTRVGDEVFLVFRTRRKPTDIEASSRHVPIDASSPPALSSASRKRGRKESISGIVKRRQSYGKPEDYQGIK